jgi:WD40 repeat protein
LSCVYILFSISGFQISNSSRAYQLGSLTDVSFAKCLAWLPVPELEGVIAIGQMNGRVMLTSVLGSGETSPLNGKEYASKHNRQCNTLAWGLAEPYVLAAGFDKHRSEHGLILWDVTKGGSDGNRPFLESAFGDTITSVTWFSHSQTMAAGVNNKQLRLYDLRGKKVQHDFLPLQ